MLRLIGFAAALGAALAPHAAPAPQGAEYEVFYHHVLRNRTDRELANVIVYLPVPPSDGYQQVEGFRVERTVPVHISNRTDAFGNRIKRVAIAALAPRAEVEVGFSCVLRLSPPAQIDLAPSEPAPLDGSEPLPPHIRDHYTRDHNIFGIGTPVIREPAAALLQKHPGPVERARAIHDLVASTLRYEGGNGWDPAPVVLQRRAGSCSEFAYVFCALSRATGIPTRFVGASIFPSGSKLPFQDHGHHRWAEAYLPGHGWVPFDPTLDRGKPAKQRFVGTHHGRTLILTRTGDKSLQLGLSYVGANSHTGETSRARWFTWSQGTAAKLDEALALLASGRRRQAERALRRIVEEQPGTRAAREAELALAGGPEAAAEPKQGAGSGTESPADQGMAEKGIPSGRSPVEDLPRG